MVLDVLPNKYIKSIDGYGKDVLDFENYTPKIPTYHIKNKEGVVGDMNRALYLHGSEIRNHTVCSTVTESDTQMLKALQEFKDEGMRLSAEAYIESVAGCAIQRPHFDYVHTNIANWEAYLNGVSVSHGCQVEAEFNHAYQHKHGFASKNMSYSLVYALMDNTEVNIYSYEKNEQGKWIVGETIVVNLRAGQMLLFDRTVLHSGAKYDTYNVRIHAYYENGNDLHSENAIQWFAEEDIKEMLKVNKAIERAAKKTAKKAMHMAMAKAAAIMEEDIASEEE